jgi:hypothetical protein
VSGTHVYATDDWFSEVCLGKRLSINQIILTHTPSNHARTVTSVTCVRIKRTLRNNFSVLGDFVQLFNSVGAEPDIRSVLQFQVGIG